MYRMSNYQFSSLVDLRVEINDLSYPLPLDDVKIMI